MVFLESVFYLGKMNVGGLYPPGLMIAYCSLGFITGTTGSITSLFTRRGCLWHNKGNGCSDVKGKECKYLIVDIIVAYCHT
jgi:hypothetical protein